MAPDSQNPGRVTEIQVRVDCNGCVQKVKKALHGITGIYDLYVDFSQQKLTIIGSADPEKIVRAIRKTRKTAIIVCSSSSHVDQQPADTPPPQPPDQLLHENDDVQPAEESNPVPPPAAAEAPPPPREPSPPPPPPNDPPAQLQPEDQNQRQEESLSNQNHPASNYPPRRQGDAGEVHVVYHHQQPPPPPDHYGYRYGYGGSSSTTPGYHQFERYRDGPQRYPQVPPQMEQQPVYVTNNSPQVQWQNQGWANPSHRPESFGSRLMKFFIKSSKIEILPNVSS
ncbi:Heavy metal-associated isoprenylated plant protein 28 [Linum grandiflorum]